MNYCFLIFIQKMNFFAKILEFFGDKMIPTITKRIKASA